MVERRTLEREVGVRNLHSVAIIEFPNQLSKNGQKIWSETIVFSYQLNTTSPNDNCPG